MIKAWYYRFSSLVRGFDNTYFSMTLFGIFLVTFLLVRSGDHKPVPSKYLAGELSLSEILRNAYVSYKTWENIRKIELHIMTPYQYNKTRRALSVIYTNSEHHFNFLLSQIYSVSMVPNNVVWFESDYAQLKNLHDRAGFLHERTATVHLYDRYLDRMDDYDIIFFLAHQAAHSYIDSSRFLKRTVSATEFQAEEFLSNEFALDMLQVSGAPKEKLMAIASWLQENEKEIPQIDELRKRHNPYDHESFTGYIRPQYEQAELDL